MNAYEVLGLTPNADIRAIKTAYFALMKAHHPDRRPASGSRVEDFAVELNIAYGLLKSPQAKARYDAALARARCNPKIAPPKPNRRRARPVRSTRRALRIRNVQLATSATLILAVFLVLGAGSGLVWFNRPVAQSHAIWSSSYGYAHAPTGFEQASGSSPY